MVPSVTSGATVAPFIRHSSQTAPDTHLAEFVSVVSGGNWHKLEVMFARRSLVFAAIAAIALPGAALAHQRREGDHDDAREAVARGEALPLSEILRIVRRVEPGEVIEVELERDDGRLEYEIEVLTQSGRVRKVTLDARTGAILETEDED